MDVGCDPKKRVSTMGEHFMGDCVRVYSVEVICACVCMAM